MRRESHVRFWEGGGVKLPSATRLQLLVCFAAERFGVRPCRIQIEQLTAPLILDFLDSLERERSSTIGTRNVRLAAFKSFFRYLEYHVPACLDLARQVDAIPMKRRDEAMVESLNRDELRVLLDAPDPTTGAGVRDRAMLHLTYAAGLRVSELIGVMCTDLALPHLDTVRVTGKGRRERVLPLWRETRSALRDWLRVRPDNTGHDHLFLNARGKAITRHGFAHRLRLHATTARQRMPSSEGEREERGELTLQEAAQRLGVSEMTVLREIHRGVIAASQACKGAPWIIAVPALEKARRTAPGTKQGPTTADPNQKTLVL